MQVSQIVKGHLTKKIEKTTNQEMQNEYNYLLAEQLTEKLLVKGLITEEEFEKVMVKNRQSFSPFISKITSKKLAF